MTLAYRQRLDITDASGRLRCPGCGRWRREADFGPQAEDVSGPDWTVTVLPMCRACIGALRGDEKETP